MRFTPLVAAITTKMKTITAPTLPISSAGMSRMKLSVVLPTVSVLVAAPVASVMVLGK